MSIRYFLLIFFLSSISSCSANPVTCKNGTTTCTYNGNSSGYLSIGDFTDVKDIAEVDLSNKTFTGIHETFWSKDWNSLTHLDLSLNQISQTLPKAISKLTSLESLILSTNSFSGEVPFADLTILKKLKKLDLARNQFNGSLNGTLVGNKSYGIANLSSLEHLNLSSNSFQGEIPQNISRLAHLKHLDLSNNKNLTGPIISNLSKINPLERLNLSGINLEEEKDLSSIGNLTNLSQLDLSNTNLHVVIPAEIKELKSLKELDLSHNKLTGEFSGFNILTNIVKLNLSSNNLEGRIPDFSNMTVLRVLDLSHNILTGPIPDFSNMKWRELDLSGNQFNGNGNKSIGTANFSSLEHLSLSSNSFQGKILQNISRLAHLKHLDLSNNNNLTGPIISNLSKIYPLKYLSLSGINLEEENNLSSIGNLTNLSHLDLSNTNLHVVIPAEIKELKSLEELDLSSNKLIGPIPDFSNMTALTVLNLSHNNLSGNISEAMEKKMQNMRMVDISNNGKLTSCSTNMTFLSSYGIRTGSYCGVGTFLESSKSKTTIVLAVVLPIFFMIVIFAFLVFAYRRRRKPWAPKLLRFSGDCSSQGGPYKFQTDAKEWVVDVKLPTTVPVLIFDRPLTKISFADLLIATSNFSRQSLLAEENSGLVYAGYLPEGHPVAIKVLVNGLTLSDQEVADELERLAQIKHQNLVQLLGYCFAGRQRIVIYDYNMHNGTLRDLLHKVSDYREHGKNFSLEDEKYEVEEMANDGQVQNTWEFRHKIALGVARGLAFLHHGCSPSIIHGLIRARSILLDSNLEPRLSDYALYRLTSIKFQDDNPYGSPGYMAEATAESDVYDFGILLFELLTGKQAYDDQNPGLTADNNLVSWVRGLSKKDMLPEAIDAKIRGTGPEKQMEEALKIGYLCTADIPSKRPSMKQVIGLLKDIQPNVENNGN